MSSLACLKSSFAGSETPLLFPEKRPGKFRKHLAPAVVVMSARCEILGKGPAFFPKRPDGGGNPDVPEIPCDLFLTAPDEQLFLRQYGIE